MSDAPFPVLPTFGKASLRGLARLRDAKRRRASSWDRTGGNRDSVVVPAGETVTLLDTAGAGAITHIWCTVASDDPLVHRNLSLRMYWDGEADPSVATPLGDFFGMGHAMTRNFATPMLAMSPQDGRGLNCYFPMPFADGARVTVTNDGETDCRAFYFYVDYEAYDRLEDGLGRFHAWWNRENPATAEAHNEGDGKNLDGAGNYLILDAAGKGHYVGCHLDYDNVHVFDPAETRRGPRPRLVMVRRGRRHDLSLTATPCRRSPARARRITTAARGARRSFTSPRTTASCCRVARTGRARSPCTATTSKTPYCSTRPSASPSSMGTRTTGATTSPAPPTGIRRSRTSPSRPARHRRPRPAPHPLRNPLASSTGVTESAANYVAGTALRTRPAAVRRAASQILPTSRPTSRYVRPPKTR